MRSSGAGWDIILGMLGSYGRVLFTVSMFLVVRSVKFEGGGCARLGDKDQGGGW